MRKLFSILVVSMLVMSALAPAALAEPKPADEYIPMPVDPDPGYAFEDWWIELDPALGGSGTILPQDDVDFAGPGAPFDIGHVYGGVYGRDRSGNTSMVHHGLPIGFNFKFMQGPALGTSMYWEEECYKVEGEWVGCWTGNPNPMKWKLSLSNEGFNEAWVGTYGYIAFHLPILDDSAAPGNLDEELGLLSVRIPEGESAMWSVPNPWTPNNIIAPFFTPLATGDNTFTEVSSVAFVCDALDDECGDCFPGAKTVKCNRVETDLVSGPGGCVCDKDECWLRDCIAGCEGDPACEAECEDNQPRVQLQGYWVPCDTHDVMRPRGRVLYKTVGTEPNRKFVVEWSNARALFSGHLATFQMQLWEGNNAILFLYKDFKPLSFWEDPPHESAFNLYNALYVGMEDTYGLTGVGEAFTGYRGMTFGFFNPLDELSARAFVPDAYVGVRAFVP